MKQPDTTKAESSAPSNRNFAGTDNQGHLRALAVLRHRSASREELDGIAGCANGPALVAALRARGLTIPCTHFAMLDHDDKLCRHGSYTLTADDHRKINAWIAKRDKKSAASTLANYELDFTNGPF